MSGPMWHENNRGFQCLYFIILAGGKGEFESRLGCLVPRYRRQLKRLDGLLNPSAKPRWLGKIAGENYMNALIIGY